MKNPLIWRLVLALLSGGIVAGLCLDNVSKGAATYYARYPQIRTRRRFENFEKAIATYRSKNGKLPASLGEIHTHLEECFGISDLKNASEMAFDGWHRPLIYRVAGDKYLLVSYGADGKPGGMGLEHDLTSDNPNPPEAKLSRLDNLRYPDSQSMNFAAIVCGLFVSLITFQSIKNEALERRKWLGTAIGLAVLLVATSFVSLFITLMHVPSGH